jgi:hypothetical protein
MIGLEVNDGHWVRWAGTVISGALFEADTADSRGRNAGLSGDSEAGAGDRVTRTICSGTRRSSLTVRRMGEE